MKDKEKWKFLQSSQKLILRSVIFPDTQLKSVNKKPKFIIYTLLQEFWRWHADCDMQIATVRLWISPIARL